MEKRSFRRMTSKIDARLFHGNLFYSGTVLNFSEQGMFLNSNLCLPSDSLCLIMIRENSSLFNFLAKVKYAKRTDDYSRGMGIELLNPSKHYLDFVENFSSSTEKDEKKLANSD